MSEFGRISLSLQDASFLVTRFEQPTADYVTQLSRASLLARHMNGDWGELDEHDRNENELALNDGFRILSSYALSNGVRIWVITEADRSSTRLLLPSEY